MHGWTGTSLRRTPARPPTPSVPLLAAHRIRSFPPEELLCTRTNDPLLAAVRSKIASLRQGCLPQLIEASYTILDAPSYMSTEKKRFPAKSRVHPSKRQDLRCEASRRSPSHEGGPHTSCRRAVIRRCVLREAKSPLCGKSIELDNPRDCLIICCHKGLFPQALWCFVWWCFAVERPWRVRILKARSRIVIE